MIKADVNTISKNPKLGWYEIGGKIFWDKASALLEGSKLGLGYDNLKWNFNDDEFSKYNWAIEPQLHIKGYYHLRAKQIREKYDYLILNFSGGSDSTTILYSFIQQGLFIDEVVVRVPKAALKKFGVDQFNRHSSNEFSEYELAAKPILKWLEKVSPNTKITIQDFSETLIKDKIDFDENFIHWTGDYTNAGCIARYLNTSNIDALRTFDKGKRTAIIFGTDKPRVVYRNNQLNFYCVDRAVHSALPAAMNNGFDNVDVELFYWTPDLPELMIKQCHLIKQWFEQPANKKLSYMLDYWWQTTPSNRGTYESIIKGIIYPDYDLTTWQADKTSVSALETEWDWWMNDYKDTEGYKTLRRGVDHLFNHVSRDFMAIADVYKTIGSEFTMTNWEFKPCRSKMYYIGTIDQS